MRPTTPSGHTAPTEDRGTADPATSARTPVARPATRWLWLVGTALAVLAVHSNWHVAIAAWLFPIFLMRYARLRPARVGIPRVGFAIAVSTIVWLGSTSLLFAVNTLILPVFAALTVLQALAFAADRLVATRLEARSGLLSTLIFPVSLVTAEYLFTLLLRFGDYGALGFTQHANAPLIQLASVTGVYGVSFVVAWFASVVTWAWDTGFRWSVVRRNVLVYAGVLALVLAAGGIRLAFLAPTTDTVRTAGISASADAVRASGDAQERAGIPYGDAADVAEADEGKASAAFAPVTDELVARTQREAAAGARVIQWPETQARVLESDKDALVDEVADIARDEETYVNLAFALYGTEKPRLRNVAVLITPDGETAWTYDKAQPTPMEALRGIEPGDGDVPVTDSQVGRLATVICYDADFPDLMRQAAGKDAALVLVPANDWLGFENLHAERATLRSVEYGYAQVRQSTNGLSTAIDHQGRVLAMSDHFTTDRQTMIAEVPVQPRTATVYSAIGDVFAWLCLGAAAALAALAGHQARRGRREG